MHPSSRSSPAKFGFSHGYVLRRRCRLELRSAAMTLTVYTNSQCSGSSGGNEAKAGHAALAETYLRDVSTIYSVVSTALSPYFTSTPVKKSALFDLMHGAVVQPNPWLCHITYVVFIRIAAVPTPPSIRGRERRRQRRRLRRRRRLMRGRRGRRTTT